MYIKHVFILESSNGAHNISSDTFSNTMTDVVKHTNVRGNELWSISLINSSFEKRRMVAHQLAIRFQDKKITTIMSVYGPGLPVATLMADIMRVKLVVASDKRHVIVGPTKSDTFRHNKYTFCMEIEGDALEKNEQVLVVDDILGKGCVSLATSFLVEKFQATTVGYAFVAEIESYKGRKIISLEYEQVQIESFYKV